MKRFRQKEPTPETPESCDGPERKPEDILKERQPVLNPRPLGSTRGALSRLWFTSR